MLDAADFLTVTGPDRQPLELRVDPIDQDPSVNQAVHDRAGDNPPSHVVPAGQTAHLPLPLFNRGWARYPMLAAGTYTIAFAYQPQWREPAWTQQGFGRVESKPITVQVTRPAPLALRQASRPLQLDLAAQGDTLVAELVSTWDRDLWVNLNIGGPSATHARLVWQPVPTEPLEVDQFELESDATDPAFRPGRLGRLPPGQRLLLARTAPAALRQRLRTVTTIGHPLPPLVLRYSYLPSAAWPDLRPLLQSKAPSANLPAQIFTGTVTSEPLRLAEVSSDK